MADIKSIVVDEVTYDINDTTARSAVATHSENEDIHVTDDDKTAWNNKYNKPDTGIPSTDLASTVQTSLGLANSSVQETVSATEPTGQRDGDYWIKTY